ncbi:MAG: hypothetical protein EHM36_00715 [Deltaproteobacteria bacterium]|nr:MAG: hypothetical protein EHM36_00715 [Deltaproteobacteria bacterium]
MPINKRKTSALVIYVTPDVKRLIKYEAIKQDTWEYSIATEAVLVYFKYLMKAEIMARKQAKQDAKDELEKLKTIETKIEETLEERKKFRPTDRGKDE